MERKDGTTNVFKMFLGDFKLEEKINEDVIRIKKLIDSKNKRII
jgi:hypothetical protein